MRRFTMPNWCDNDLTISASPEQLCAIKEKILRETSNHDDGFCVDFNLLTPRPKDLDIISGGYGFSSQTLLEFPAETLLTDDVIWELVTKDGECGLRLSLLSRERHWTVGQFVDWLWKHPKEQDYFRYDLALGQRYLDNIKKYGVPTWYEWSYQYWGVKWNVYEDDVYSVSIDEKTIVCTFSTAWNPPNEWFATLCEAFPDSEFSLKYWEPGNFFAGELLSTGDGAFIDNACQTEEDIMTFARTHFGEPFDEE